MLPRVVLRFSSSAATVVERHHKRRPSRWLVGAVFTGVAGGTWFASSKYADHSSERGAGDGQDSLGRQQQQQQLSLPASALASIKATAARWLAKKAEDPESREALLAFGSSRLLDFLVTTATEEPSLEQQHAEQAVVNFLGGYHTASRLLARPGAVPHLLQHIAAGKASPQLTAALQTVVQGRAADFSQGLCLDDARQTIQLLQGVLAQQQQMQDNAAADGGADSSGGVGCVLQGLALQLLTAWSEAGQNQKVKLSSLGVAPVLGQLAMHAVTMGDAGRDLQGEVCRLQQLLLVDPSTVTDADLATWMQPLLYMAADAAAAAAAAAAASAAALSNSTVRANAAAAGGGGGGGGMLGSAAGAADLALADAAMTTLAAAVATGGPLVKEALKGLHWLPTLDCLALSPDPAIKARAAAALAALVTAGQLDSQDAQLRWRDMLLGWLGTSAGNLLLHTSSSGSGSGGGGESQQQQESSLWLWQWFGSDSGSGGSSSESSSSKRAQASAADEALARSCVAGLKALAQQDGPLGLSVAQLWLSQLLQQLSSRIAAYTSITQLAQTPAQAAAAVAAAGLLPRPAKADAHNVSPSPPAAAAASFGPAAAGAAGGAGSSGAAGGGRSGNGSSDGSSWSWWGSSSSSSSATAVNPPPAAAGEPGGVGGGVGGPPSPTAPSASSRSWYWPFNSSDGDVPLTSQHAGQADAAGAAGAKVPTVVDAAALDGVATSLQLEQQQQAGGTSSSSKGASKAAAAAASGGSSSGRGVSDAEATLIESARAALWRDAAPVTAASAKAAADDLRAAANAMLTAWLGAAGSLNLPSDLMPGMFAPAVVEAYPAAARVVDFSVAQQRTCAVLELLASVVAENPSKQAWLLSAGILPVMERLALHADAVLEPQAFVNKYSSNSDGNGSGSSDTGRRSAGGGDGRGSGSGGEGGGQGGASGSSNLSLSARIGRSFWGWKGSSGGDAGGADGGSGGAAGDGADVAAAGPNKAGSSSDSNAPKPAQQDSSAAAVAAAEQQQQGRAKPSQLLLVGLLDQLDFSSSGSNALAAEAGAAAAAGGQPAAVATAVAAAGSWLADAVQSKFTAAAIASPRDAKSAPAAASGGVGGQEAEVGTDGKQAAGKGPAAAAAAASGQQQQQHRYRSSAASSAALMMEFAQGTAGWEEMGYGSSSGASRQSGGHTVPPALADGAAAITAAAEEGATWGDGDGLTLLRLQRQVARILSMLALQPAAAQQLTEVAQKLPGGAADLLQGLQQFAEVSKHLHHTPQAARAAAAAVATTPGSSHSSVSAGGVGGGSSSSGSVLSRQERHKQAVAAASAASSPSAALATTAAWLPWLLEAAASDDCLLSSYATKALLHLESTVAYSSSRRRQQSLLQRLQQQHQAQAAGGPADTANSSTWSQRLVQELRSSDELVQFVEGLWPFSNSTNSTASPAWRPPVYYPDGVHLMHPIDGHNWGMLQPPPVSLIDSISAAAASAASAAAAAAASDLAQSDIELGLDTQGLGGTADGPPSPAAASVAAAASAVANAAAAAAAAAAASALGARPGDSASNDTPAASGAADASVVNAADTGGGGGAAAAAVVTAGDVGFLQPAVSWLAHKLVRFAAIKEEEAQQALQEATASVAATPSNPAAPLSTYDAVQGLVGREGESGCVAAAAGTAATAAVAGITQQQQQNGPEEIVNTAPAAAAQQPAAPEIDIVFIHGIRGGPFVSWRKGNSALSMLGGAGAGGAAGTAGPSSVAVDGSSTSAASSGSGGSGKPVKRQGVSLKPSTAAAVHSRHMTQEECWPAAWLAADVPNARLLTVEYKAPVTGWEGESLSLPDCGRLLLDKLVAAGVGQRPVVFVCHSMGGLIVKEMLSQSLDEAPGSRRGRLAAATCALAFYATPHFGSGMAALGWKLRHLPGASPAPSIHHLSPGPHLSALNSRLAQLHASGRVAVLSLCEGLATNLAGLDFMPRILIVPFESAYPGFGEVHVLRDQDHISVCKPASPQAPAYKLLLDFVQASVARALAAQEASAESDTGGEGGGQGGRAAAAAAECAAAAAEAAAASS